MFGILMRMKPLTHDAYNDEWIEDKDFNEIFQQLRGQVHVEEGNKKVEYHIYDVLWPQLTPIKF